MKPFFYPLAAVFWLLCLPVSARVLINELNINPPGGDDAKWQYVEILTIDDDGNPEAQTLGNVTLLIIDSNGGMVGDVQVALDLEGLSTGTNGLLLIGPAYDDEVPWTIPAQTAVADYADLARPGGAGDIGPKSGLTAFLVEDFTGQPGDDLDGLDGGDIGRDDLYGDLLDSIGFGDFPYETELVLDFAPDNLSRISGENLQNSTSPWIGGDFLDTDGPRSLTFDTFFGSFTGTATPGAPNPSPPSQNPIRINEVLVNPPGEDANVEFIELISTTGAIATTNNLWLLVVDSHRDENLGGMVLEAWNLHGQSTGTNGLLVLGNNYERSANPWKDLISSDTSLFDPESGDQGGSAMGDGDIGSNAAISILLVRDFTGTAAAGGAIGTDLDVDDDGQIDQRPWDVSEGDQGILDSVGFDQVNAITGEVLWQTYAPGDVTQTGNLALTEPDSLVRNPANLAPNEPAAWMGGNIGGESTTGIAYQPEASFGDFITQVSPGQPNPPSTPAQALILINEVHLDPPGEDGNFEYIEFLSPSRTFTAFQNLTLLVIDVEGENKGEITDVFALRGLSTGGNGLMLMGDSFNDTDVYPGIPEVVHRTDPAGLNAGEIGPNSGVALLLVEGFNGQQTDDVDTNDDGIFDAIFWDSIRDSVAFGSELEQQENIANFNSVGFTPDAFSRIPGDFRQNDVRAWYGGTLEGSVSTDLTYGETFGPFAGEGSPGRFNLAGPRRSEPILINEVNVNPPGSDENFEYIELISPTGGRHSTNDLSLVVLETAGSSVGDILSVWHLDGMSTGSNGLLLLGNKYAPAVIGDEFREGYWDSTLFSQSMPNTPFPGVNEKVTAVGDPIDLDNGDIGPDGSFSMILVAGFTGAVGQDVDANDDGVLDIDVPWRTTVNSTDGVIDGVGFLSYDDSATPPAFNGKTLAADLSAFYPELQGFQPDNISRRVGNFTANDPAAWFGGEIAGDLPDGLVYGVDFFGLPQQSATPGAPNGEDTPPDADDDGDGVSNAKEAIAGTDPQDPTDYLRVTSAVRGTDGAATLTWTSVEGKTYEIEYSVSLTPESWEVISTMPLPAAGATTVFTDDDAGRAAIALGFYRVRVAN